ncbi:hypothetical protein EYF80_033072 [Liparis tanakae]|uniref:Uncharacterized protein n=1 Tax=Liparis tanakae TaxID=230148 RepID=A0A4Z2GSZ9_9TELE|nr:hypothetical protein EYF80_033072 [Liparis tanakae]
MVVCRLKRSRVTAERNAGMLFWWCRDGGEGGEERGESRGMLGRKRESDRGMSRGMSEKRRGSGSDECREEAPSPGPSWSYTRGWRGEIRAEEDTRHGAAAGFVSVMP